ncbi:MAG: hypothetical protein IGS03_14080 [Candidatus Sericytochromatia bacterium]|nr:hypothetical protein [Candidatus Sericytochromatia bacterium]
MRVSPLQRLYSTGPELTTKSVQHAVVDTKTAQIHDRLSFAALPTQKQPDAAIPLDFIPDQEPETVLLELVKMRNAGPEGEWYSEQGACMDFAARWLSDLQQRGIPVRFAMTQTTGPQGQVQVPSGQQSRDLFHAFLILDTPRGELILDPIWKQFSADKQAIRYLPSVLLGSLAEIKAVYQAAHSTLQLETHGAAPYQGQYELNSLVELLYSAGSAQPFRQFLKDAQTETDKPVDRGTDTSDG